MTTQSGPTLYDPQSEEITIGSALLSAHLPSRLPPDAFHDATRRRIWSVMLDLEQQGHPITLENVITASGAQDGDGARLLLSLTRSLTQTSSALSGPIQAERVAEFHALRRLQSILEDTMRRAVVQREPLQGVISDLVNSAASVLVSSAPAHRLPVESVLDSYLDRVATPIDVWGLRTGFHALDEEFGGLHPGETFILAGIPGVGKTAFAMQLAMQLAGQTFWQGQFVARYPGAVFELEMAETRIVERAVCAIARVDYRLYKRGRLNQEESDRAVDALDRLRALPVWISDRTDWTTLSLRAEVIRLQAEEGIQWIVVDYADLLKDSASNDIERQARISRALHDIAKLGVTVIAIDTLNKSGLRGEGDSTADVSGSVKKMYDADVGALLRIPKGENGRTNRRQLVFSKTREADRFLSVPFVYIGPQRRFVPPDGGSS